MDNTRPESPVSVWASGAGLQSEGTPGGARPPIGSTRVSRSGSKPYAIRANCSSGSGSTAGTREPDSRDGRSQWPIMEAAARTSHPDTTSACRGRAAQNADSAPAARATPARIGDASTLERQVDWLSSSAGLASSS
jgi:hypothetical protein